MRQQAKQIGKIIMKNQRVTIYFIALAFLLIIINVASAQATERNVDWECVSENLVDALQSNNPGLQQSAMRLIIQYADQVDVDEAVFSLMRLYRHSDDSKVRQMALVTLHKIEDDYAMDFVQNIFFASCRLYEKFFPDLCNFLI